MSKSDGGEPLGMKRKLDQRDDADPQVYVVLMKILPMLPLKEQIRLERVNKLVQSVVNKFLMSVKTLDLNDCLPSHPGWQYRSGGFGIFRSVIRRLGPHLTSVSFPGGTSGRFCQPELLLLNRNCPQLRHLSFHLTPKSLSAMEKLSNQLGQLTSLKLNIPEHRGDEVNAFEKRMGTSISSLPNLKNLEIKCPSYAHGHGSVLKGTFLSALSISIDSLSLSYLTRINDELLANFLRSHPGLKKFEINTVWYDHRTTVPMLLAQYCTGLKQLKITGCQSGSFHLSSGTAFGTAVRSLSQLEQVDVAPNCCFTDSDLTSLCASCPNIRVLRIGNQHTDAFLSNGLQNLAGNLRLSLDGLIHLGVLKNLQFVSLDCFMITITAEIVSALCQGNGSKVEDFHVCTNREPNGWRKFTEKGMSDFIEAIGDHSRSKFVRIEVDRVGRRVWLKQSTNICYLPLRMENLHP